MNTEFVDRVVDAVLYEGYILYPYRRSVKNHSRWTFGCLEPGGKPVKTQCLVETSAETEVEVQVRCLHLVDRRVARLRNILGPVDDASNLEAVTSLEVAGVRHESWQEAIERRIDIVPLRMDRLLSEPIVHTFEFPATRLVEPLYAGDGPVAAIIRTQQSIQGIVEVRAEAIADDLVRLTVRIENQSPPVPGDQPGTETSLQAMASTHTILAVEQGRFVSLVDPAACWQDKVDALQNEGSWPVLVGREGDRTTMLSSPIILYDYPQVAAESPGNLFDGLEIDEILSLRIMTLTDDEREQAAALDERARELLARTRSLSDQQMGNLHGAIRGFHRVPSPANSHVPTAVDP